ncbi:MAG TPA: hydroxymethylglutaryl-CoA reductase, degradative [Woeseiaceae bacterium]|nr:hydroxymethylglutaryl-CoA reductase, degradative [Woeseiaceae bacterium]
MNESKKSRLAGFHNLTVSERIAELEGRGYLSAENARLLASGRQVLSVATADKMIENVVGVFGLPLAVAPNFIVNNREYIVPLVVEEPSIVAALGSAAVLARRSGGFSVNCDESLLAGQIHVLGVSDVDAAIAALIAAKEELLTSANAVHPRLLKRGGGARDIEARPLTLDDGTPLIALHVLVDTCDAMGANLVNTICEAIAPMVIEICGGEVALRILSNLVDRSLVVASVRYPASVLATSGMGGEEVRDRIVRANAIAMADSHRAATHNKGVMNGIDAVAIATGNDWRALEAGAHAYAARLGRYSALTRWSVSAAGDLEGELAIPLKVGIVGGTLASNEAARLGLALCGVQSAKELAQVMAAVGLAQNFSALRALVTSGIQEGHMRMHARSVANSAGARPDQLGEVIDRMLASGEVKAWKAAEILAEMTPVVASGDTASATAAGKLILFGEHAVVYGRHALALPIPDAVKASVAATDGQSELIVPEWGLRIGVDRNSSDGAVAALNLILGKMSVADSGFAVTVSSRLPRGMGLGSSAAIAVAIIRALAKHQQIELTDNDVNDIAFECEKLAHGTPSGIDNTVCCYGKPVLFRKSDSLGFKEVQTELRLPIVVGFSRAAGSTLEQVAGVRRRREKNRQRYDAIFDQIDGLSIDGAHALANRQYGELGMMMNVCHGLLNALQVSTPDLENMVDIARRAGAIGAKLTGAGGGGSIVALCPGVEKPVRAALHAAGYSTLQMEPGE